MITDGVHTWLRETSSSTFICVMLREMSTLFLCRINILYPIKRTSFFTFFRLTLHIIPPTVSHQELLNDLVFKYVKKMRPGALAAQAVIQ